jgi:hypothetical protein
MKKYYKAIGIILYLIGLLFILMLLAKGFHYITIESDYIFALFIFIAILSPSLGAQLIRKSKRLK